MKKLQKRNKVENSVKMYKTIACPCFCFVPHYPVYTDADSKADTKSANNK